MPDTLAWELRSRTQGYDVRLGSSSDIPDPADPLAAARAPLFGRERRVLKFQVPCNAGKRKQKVRFGLTPIQPKLES
jgi:hypothetical protein